MRKRCERDRTQKAKFELSISAQRKTSKSPFVSNPAYHDAMRDLRCSTSRIFKCDERKGGKFFLLLSFSTRISLTYRWGYLRVIKGKVSSIQFQVFRGPVRQLVTSAGIISLQYQRVRTKFAMYCGHYLGKVIRFMHFNYKKSNTQIASTCISSYLES